VVVNNQIRKGLLLTLSAICLNRKIFGKVTSKNVIVSCTFFVFLQCVGQVRKVHEKAMLLPVTLPKERAGRGKEGPEGMGKRR